MASTALFAELVPTEVVDALGAAFSFWKSLPFTYVFIGHCLFCSMSAQEFRDRFMVHYVLTFLWGNGGGVVTALLLMSPQHAKFSFFSSNQVVGIWTVCWWLINYCPGGIFYTLLSDWRIKVFAKSCTALSRALLIVQRVDLAVKLFPGVVAAPLLLGTLAGCGGRLIADSMMHGWQAMPGLAELTSPGFVSRSAAMAAATYYTLGHVAQLLPLPAAAGLVVTTLVVHSFATEITGQPLDFTAPVASLLHAITHVPAAPPQPAPPAPEVAFSRSSNDGVKDSSPAAKKPPAGKTKTPSKTPTKNTPNKQNPISPSGAAAAWLGDVNAPGISGAAANGVCAVQPTPGGAEGAAGVVKAADAKLLAEGSLAAARPRRSQRKAAAASYAS